MLVRVYCRICMIVMCSILCSVPFGAGFVCSEVQAFTSTMNDTSSSMYLYDKNLPHSGEERDAGYSQTQQNLLEDLLYQVEALEKEVRFLRDMLEGFQHEDSIRYRKMLESIREVEDIVDPAGHGVVSILWNDFQIQKKQGGMGGMDKATATLTKQPNREQADYDSSKDLISNTTAGIYTGNSVDNNIMDDGFIDNYASDFTSESRLLLNDDGSSAIGGGQRGAVSSDDMTSDSVQALDSLFDKVRKTMQGGSPVVAKHDLEYIVEHAPDDYEKAGEAYYWLGEIALLNGDPDLARRHFIVSVNKYPDNRKASSALLRFGVMIGDLGNKVGACDIIVNKMSEKYPSLPVFIERWREFEVSKLGCASM